jgi:hypothetical protein
MVHEGDIPRLVLVISCRRWKSARLKTSSEYKEEKVQTCQNRTTKTLNNRQIFATRHHVAGYPSQIYNRPITFRLHPFLTRLI